MRLQCVCVCVCGYIYVYTHTHTHTYTHIPVQSPVLHVSAVDRHPQGETPIF